MDNFIFYLMRTIIICALNVTIYDIVYIKCNSLTLKIEAKNKEKRGLQPSGWPCLIYIGEFLCPATYVYVYLDTHLHTHTHTHTHTHAPANTNTQIKLINKLHFYP